MTALAQSFALSAADDACFGEGWGEHDAAGRLTQGARSVLRLPPLHAPDGFVLTLDGARAPGGGRRLTLTLNGATLRRFDDPDVGLISVVAPGDLLRGDGDNLLVLDQPDASLALRALTVEPLDAPAPLGPRLVAPAAAPAQARALVEAFQSLGDNGELAGLQSACGVEPLGLLRHARIAPAALLRGLRTRFSGLGDLDKLSFGGEPLRGSHAVYGLDYPTSKRFEPRQFAEFAAKEALRLKYLARLLIEELERNEKIFVRGGGFETPEAALALHAAMRAFHPQARLLILSAAPAAAPERAGRVLALRPRLYRGHAPAPTLALMAAVAAGAAGA